MTTQTNDNSGGTVPGTTSRSSRSLLQLTSNWYADWWQHGIRMDFRIPISARSCCSIWENRHGWIWTKYIHAGIFIISPKVFTSTAKQASWKPSWAARNLAISGKTKERCTTPQIYLLSIPRYGIRKTRKTWWAKTVPTFQTTAEQPKIQHKIPRIRHAITPYMII